MSRLSIAVGLAGGLVAAASLVEAAETIDEFLPLLAAQRLLAGEVPYRDFVSLYGPLWPLVDAAAFRVFAPAVIAARVVFLAALVATFVVVARLAARVSGSERRGAAIGLVAALAAGRPSWGYALVPAVALVMGALLAVLRARDDGARRWLAVAGALLGLAAITRHEVAIAAALPLGVGVLLSARTRRDAALDALTLGGAASVFPLVAFIWLACAGALGATWEQLVTVPAGVYRRDRGLPWPPFVSLAFFAIYAPLLVGLGTLVVALARERAGPAIASSGLALTLALPGLVRPESARFMGVRLAACVAVAAAARGPLGRGRQVLLIATLVVLAVPGLDALGHAGSSAAAALGRNARFVDAGPELGLLEPEDWASEQAAIEAVTSRAEGTRIFVGQPRHDRIWYADPKLYFDAKALPATRVHVLEPWARAEAIQRAIVADIERARAPFVVLVDGELPDEPNGSRESSGAHDLDIYIAETYEPRLTAPPYHVLARRAGK